MSGYVWARLMVNPKSAATHLAESKESHTTLCGRTVAEFGNNTSKRTDELLGMRYLCRACKRTLRRQAGK
jgi:hypothetical protein